MSAFDDEFGLFGDEEGVEEERKSTLGARKIASNETIIDEIEPEDEPSPRRFRGRGGPGGPPGERREGGFPGRRMRERAPRDPLPDDVAIPRAVELLTFLAQKLVSKPAAVHVNVHQDEKGVVLELEVSPDDIGKVIGRAGRVAQALRTIVRAGAEGRVTVDIVDVDEDDAEAEGAQPSAGAAAPGRSMDSDAGTRPARGRRGRGPRAERTAAEAPVQAPGDASRMVDEVEDADGEVVGFSAVPLADGDDVRLAGDDGDEISPSGVKLVAKKKARAKKATAKKTPAKKAVAKKSVAKAPALKAPAAKKTAAKKSVAKKTAAKKAPAKKTAARKKKS